VILRAGSSTGESTRLLTAQYGIVPRPARHSIIRPGGSCSYQQGITHAIAHMSPNNSIVSQAREKGKAHRGMSQLSVSLQEIRPTP
jgi:hypothetical protein